MLTLRAFHFCLKSWLLQLPFLSIGRKKMRRSIFHWFPWWEHNMNFPSSVQWTASRGPSLFNVETFLLACPLCFNIWNFYQALLFLFHISESTLIATWFVMFAWSSSSIRYALVIIQVEIVMGLEEEFGISVEEESAQTIATVQDAADLIEKLCEKKA